MKNLKQIITNVLVIVLGVMMLSFGAGYYLAGLGSGVSGYKYLDTLQTRLSGATHAKAEVYLYVAGMIIVLICLSLLIALALVSLLCDFNVIKNEKVNKWLNILKLVVSVLVLIAFVLVLASLLSMLKGTSTKLGVGYGIIVNVVLAALTVAGLVVMLLFSRKKSKTTK